MADERKDEAFHEDTRGVLEAVTLEMAGLAKRGGLTEDSLSDVLRVTLRDAVARGADLDPAAKAIILGVIRGTGSKGETALRILAHAAKAVIYHTADRGGNLAAAAKGLVLGAIAGAKGMEVDVEKAAATAARGACEGAAASGSVTVERVRAALREPIGGRKIALPESLFRA